MVVVVVGSVLRRERAERARILKRALNLEFTWSPTGGHVASEAKSADQLLLCTDLVMSPPRPWSSTLQVRRWDKFYKVDIPGPFPQRLKFSMMGREFSNTFFQTFPR